MFDNFDWTFRFVFHIFIVCLYFSKKIKQMNLSSHLQQFFFHLGKKCPKMLYGGGGRQEGGPMKDPRHGPLEEPGRHCRQSVLSLKDGCPYSFGRRFLPWMWMNLRWILAEYQGGDSMRTRRSILSGRTRGWPEICKFLSACTSCTAEDFNKKGRNHYQPLIKVYVICLDTIPVSDTSITNGFRDNCEKLIFESES